MTKAGILDFIRSNKTFLQSHFFVKTIGIFGSYAQDKASENSDIDFLIEFEDGDLDIYSLKQNLKEFLQKKLGKRIDIANPKYLKPFVKNKILDSAIYA